MPPIRLELTTPVDDDRPVYVAGPFCQWQPDVERFRLQQNAAGRFFIELPADLTLPLEYKYTRGSWESVELTGAGESVPNRIIRRKTGLHRDEVLH
ncbi:hypothetical protein ACFPMF_18620 [Larkinella bovis]|uniref:AMP-activated protein kinase glycogen-binding domain-containing protein n=1 Tax=Larkinella bovis TaxID=683041 RepID=A0ABW0ICX9_9BACT